jgi:hypothetical protein
MKQSIKHILLTFLISCYVFIVSAEYLCISEGLPDSGKTLHLAAIPKQTYPSGSRFLLKQGKNISSTPRIDLLAVADLSVTELWNNQFAELVRFSLNIFRPTAYFYILYPPREPTTA